MIKIIECPRDAIQGIHDFIPTAAKVKYLNEVLQAGFDTVDFGSFVSPKAIPQMADTAEVLKQLEFPNTGTKLLAIIANEQGAKQACQFEQISYLGFPFSISETFQLRNTGASINESFLRVESIQELCIRQGKQLVIYISMGFGNPYADPWNADIVLNWIDRLRDLGIGIFSLSDTVGIGTPAIIGHLFRLLKEAYPALEFGAHLHTIPADAIAKIDAAWSAGIRRFDTAILGYGGCPLAGYELVGNLSTRTLLEFMATKQIESNVSSETIKQLETSFQQLIHS